MMVVSNRDVIGRGLELLAADLGPFVDAYDRGRPQWAGLDQCHGCRDRSRHGTGHRSSLSDAQFLLRVLTEQWRAFNGQLSRAEQSYASELRETGNRWAHGEAFSADDTYRALDTMERLLTAVGAARQAGAIRSRQLGLQPAMTQQETQLVDIGSRTDSADAQAVAVERGSVPGPCHPRRCHPRNRRIRPAWPGPVPRRARVRPRHRLPTHL
jgi:Swt1-like HEPN